MDSDDDEPPRGFRIEELPADPVARFVEIQAEMNDVFASARVSAPMQRRLRIGLKALSKIFIEQQSIIANLKGKVEAASADLQTITPFAEIMKQQASEARTKPPPRKEGKKSLPHVAMIYPNGEGVESSVTKKAIQAAINPAELKVGISRIRQIRKGGILIETTREEDLDKIIKEIEEKEVTKNSYTAKKQVKRFPRVILYDVNPEVKKEELVERLKTQNEFLEESSIEIGFSFKGKNGTNWVLTVDPSTFFRLKRSVKIYIGWDSISFREFIRPTQCFKCWRFGHIAKFCRNKKCCAKCTEEHEEKDCKSSDKKCRNCIEFNQHNKKATSVNHESNDKKCPMVDKEIAKQRTLIDYGSE